jgi:hypothetical protein
MLGGHVNDFKYILSKQTLLYVGDGGYNACTFEINSSTEYKLKIKNL